MQTLMSHDITNQIHSSHTEMLEIPLVPKFHLSPSLQ